MRNTDERTRPSQVIDWDAFKFAVEVCEATLPIVEKLRRAVKDSTREIEVLESDPVPEKHLFNPWETRQQLHDHYLWDINRFKDLLKVQNKTAQARRYVRRLTRSWCFGHCESFDEKTGTGKLYGTYRALIGKTRTANTTRNILIATDLSPRDFER